MFRWFIALLFLLLGPLAASAQPPSPALPRGAGWTAADCATFSLSPPEGRGAECGFVSVRERRDLGASPRIDLAVAILAPVDEPAAPEPLFMAQGGPGVGTIGSFAQALLDDPRARPARNRPLVLWDQRGTGFSKPALTCPELADAERASAAGVDSATSEDAAFFAAMQVCGARLRAAGIDLGAYQSAASADDVAAIRDTLGFDRIAFYGVSYGSELGQFLMRRHPGILSAVVLDAVVPLDYDLFTEPAFAQQRIGEKYLRGCAAAPRCAKAFPDLAARYLALVDRLNADPVTVTVVPLPDGAAGPASEPVEVRLTGDMLEGAIYGALYSDLHDLAPLVIDRADKGDFTLLTTLLLPATLFDTSMAEGMHMTVTCADHGDVDAAAMDFPGVMPRLAEATRAQAEVAARVCRDWGVPPLPRGDLAPVASDLPALLLSGDFDPITPPAYAEKLLPTLPNARHVVFLAGAHGQAMASACANRIIAAFLDDPAAPLDTACAADPPREFVTADDVIFLGTLRRLMATEGVRGIALSGVLAIPAVLAAIVLATALFVYPLGALIARLSGRPPPRAVAGAAGRLSRSAPWLAAAAALLAVLCLAGLVLAVGSTLVNEQTLVVMGAIPARWSWVRSLPAAIGLAGLGLLGAAVAVWATGQRSLPGRVYLSLLSAAALGAAANLALLSR
ncbi:alpha/beta fold hydrolase [Amaricoccus solimangrovi]|uniref:alpha/beta fold hydrolase n=1 Tax=Amaricoccus solimangrovi TaxID=2589815 RepID=UPI0015E3C679|nr:alpha/beta fold hydrolase [Amaricoccus solimangrovi]